MNNLPHILSGEHGSTSCWRQLWVKTLSPEGQLKWTEMTLLSFDYLVKCLYIRPLIDPSNHHPLLHPSCRASRGGNDRWTFKVRCFSLPNWNSNYINYQQNKGGKTWFVQILRIVCFHTIPANPFMLQNNNFKHFNLLQQPCSLNK